MNPGVKLHAGNLVISFPTAPLIIWQGLFNSAVPTAGYFIVHWEENLCVVGSKGAFQGRQVVIITSFFLRPEPDALPFHICLESSLL
jgi:hypothetical protein